MDFFKQTINFFRTVWNWLYLSYGSFNWRVKKQKPNVLHNIYSLGESKSMSLFPQGTLGKIRISRYLEGRGESAIASPPAPLLFCFKKNFVSFPLLFFFFPEENILECKWRPWEVRWRNFKEKFYFLTTLPSIFVLLEILVCLASSL